MTARRALLGLALIIVSVSSVLAQGDLLPSAASTNIPAANTAAEAAQETATGVAAFNYNDFNTYAYCQYPISGNYGLLPRILFYCTIVFALIAKDFKWLIGGALASALTYSGSAAIHACILVWRGPIYGDNDVQALVAILSASCIIIVPLLNWSSTLRTIGARPIILYWGVLVTVGFVCVFIPIWTYLLIDVTFFDFPYRVRYEPTIWWPDDLSLMDIKTPDEVNVTALLRCAAPHVFDDGSINTTDGLGEYTITPQFLIDYRCENPCTSFHDMSLFHTDSEIQLLTYDQSFAAFGEVSPGSSQRKQNFINGYDTYGLIMLPYILVQGFWAALFGRRSPSQVRDNFYIFLKGLRLRVPVTRKSKTQARHYSIGAKERWQAGWLQRLVAKYWALMIYLWAVLITLICPPLFIINIVANELNLSTYIAQEPPTQVGQWSPWASTGLILFAALVSRYHYRFMHTCKSAYKYTLWRLKGRPNSVPNKKPSWAGIEIEDSNSNENTGSEIQFRPSDSYRNVGRMFEEKVFEATSRYWAHVTTPVKNFRRWLKDEWKGLFDFWVNPDLVVRQWLRHPLDHTSGAHALIAQLHSDAFPLDVRGLEIERRPIYVRTTADTMDETGAVIALGAIRPIVKRKLIARDEGVGIRHPRERSAERVDEGFLPSTSMHDEDNIVSGEQTPPEPATVAVEE